jgi:hypothetical protein
MSKRFCAVMRQGIQTNSGECNKKACLIENRLKKEKDYEMNKEIPQFPYP